MVTGTRLWDDIQALPGHLFNPYAPVRLVIPSVNNFGGAYVRTQALQLPLLVHMTVAVEHHHITLGINHPLASLDNVLRDKSPLQAPWHLHNEPKSGVSLRMRLALWCAP